MLRDRVIPGTYADEKEMAAALGFNQSTLHRWLHGKRVPSEDVARDLARRVGIVGADEVQTVMDLWAIAHIPDGWQERILEIYERSECLQEHTPV